MTSVPQRIGNYQLERQIGKGGMSEVWLGRHRSLENRLIAVKFSVRGRDLASTVAEAQQKVGPLMPAGYDADCQCEPNYLTALERHFRQQEPTCSRLRSGFGLRFGGSLRHLASMSIPKFSCRKLTRSFPEVRPECEANAGCPVGLHFRIEQRVIPLFVLH